MPETELQSMTKATFPRAGGRRYLRFLGEMHAALQPDWYLEIGTNTGDSLVRSNTKSIAIDPEFLVSQNVYGAKPALHMFQQTSDDFFKDGHMATLGAKIDLAFLDGMHWYEFLLRDFMNTERHCAPSAHVVLHDCLPWTREMTQRDRSKVATRTWTGDVWKVVPILSRYRPDLTVKIYDARPTGLVVISDLDPSNNVLWDNYDNIISEFDQHEDLAGFLDAATIHSTADSPWAR